MNHVLFSLQGCLLAFRKNFLSQEVENENLENSMSGIDLEILKVRLFDMSCHHVTNVITLMQDLCSALYL